MVRTREVNWGGREDVDGEEEADEEEVEEEAKEGLEGSTKMGAKE